MHFRVTVTPRAARVEWWICRVQREFLDRAPVVNAKCVGLDCEYTDAVKNVKQRKPEKKQRAVLQLFVA
jgi:hypothetical protein